VSLASKAGIVFEKQRQGILTDLDTLYDTRLAVVEEVDVGLALHHLKTGWSERLYDRAAPIPDDKYAELYAARDTTTLRRASPTMAVEAIRRWVLAATKSMVGTPQQGYCQLFVNVWPYKISRSEARVFAIKINEALDGCCRILMINIDPKEITALDAKSFFSCMFLQDGALWLEARGQSNDIKKIPLPDVTLYIPKILRGTISHGQLQSIRDADIFTTMEERLKPIIGLEFMEVEFFSSAIPAEAAEMITPKTA
jgi:hypothetical protein